MHSVAPLIETSEVKRALSYSAATTDTAGVDLTNYHGQLEVIISAGTFGGSATLDAKWQESDDDSTFTDCSGADKGGNAVAITQMTAAGTTKLKRAVRKFTKRYARVRFTVATAAVVFGAVQVAFPNKAQ